MRLTKVRITNFQSVQDSNEFEIGDVTCLVGKNEAGKTALLKALYRLKPLENSNGIFVAVDDYPRQSLSDYEDAVNSGSRKPANVVHATFLLESNDIDAISEIFGPDCIEDNAPTVEVNKGYSNETKIVGPNVNEEKAIAYIVEEAALPPAVKKELRGKPVQEMIVLLQEKEQTDTIAQLTQTLSEILDGSVLEIVHSTISDRLPTFLYFDQYYQLRGHDNLEALIQRVEGDSLDDSDKPLLGLISLAGLRLDQMVDPTRTEMLIARLEAAESTLTQEVLPYWSQNQHLRMAFEVHPARSGDPDGMREGTNILGRVRDTTRGVSTPLGTRSRGFVWFFSFLAWYSNTRREENNLILLLDEPGLSLHAMAQADLLRYFEEELRPHHQLIYTTHSPFMVDPKRFDRVRIVQDLSVDVQDPNTLPEEDQGTRVITDVLRARSDSLFPLQGALGYEISQTLFVGPNCLVVEGVTDLLYIQTMSGVLQHRGRDGLRDDWTITPVGGAGNVSTFVALISARTDLNVAVLIDFQIRDRQKIEGLHKEKILKKKNVLTYANYVEDEEADVEDMFEPGFYLKLVEGVYGTAIDPSNLSQQPRIVQRIEKYLNDNPMPNGAKFNHYRPALYLSNNVNPLSGNLSDQVLDRFQSAFDDLNALL